MQERQVTRVLVMLEYGPNDPDNGEVYDLTALAREIGAKADYNHADLSVTVQCRTDYHADDDDRLKTLVSFGGYTMGKKSVGHVSSSHLADVVNGSLPDGERVKRLNAAMDRTRKRLENLRFAAQEAKMEEVAAIRHLHPIARVSEAPLAAIADQAA